MGCLNYALNRDHVAFLGRQRGVKNEVVMVIVPSDCGNRSYQEPISIC